MLNPSMKVFASLSDGDSTSPASTKGAAVFSSSLVIARGFDLRVGCCLSDGGAKVSTALVVGTGGSGRRLPFWATREQRKTKNAKTNVLTMRKPIAPVMNFAIAA